MRKNYLKFAAMALFTVFILATVPQTSYAQSSKMLKQEQKETEKNYKKVLTRLKKEGWQSASSSTILELSLLKHMNKKAENPTLIEITGETSCKSINVCKQVAVNNAQNEYLQLVSGKIKGAFGSVLRSNPNITSEEIDKNVGQLTKQCEADLSNLLTPSYSIVKGDGAVKQYRTVFLADPTKIITNIERSLKETKLTIEEVKSITKFVDDELKKEAETEE